LPFLLSTIAGIWEVGRMVSAQQIIANAAREGGREVAAGQTVCHDHANLRRQLLQHERFDRRHE